MVGHLVERDEYRVDVEDVRAHGQVLLQWQSRRAERQRTSLPETLTLSASHSHVIGIISSRFLLSHQRSSLLLLLELDHCELTLRTERSTMPPTTYTSAGSTAVSTFSESGDRYTTSVGAKSSCTGSSWHVILMIQATTTE